MNDKYTRSIGSYTSHIALNKFDKGSVHFFRQVEQGIKRITSNSLYLISLCLAYIIIYKNSIKITLRI